MRELAPQSFISPVYCNRKPHNSNKTDNHPYYDTLTEKLTEKSFHLNSVSVEQKPERVIIYNMVKKNIMHRLNQQHQEHQSGGKIAKYFMAAAYQAEEPTPGTPLEKTVY